MRAVLGSICWSSEICVNKIPWLTRWEIAVSDSEILPPLLCAQRTFDPLRGRQHPRRPRPRQGRLAPSPVGNSSIRFGVHCHLASFPTLDCEYEDLLPFRASLHLSLAALYLLIE